ncbi:MAG: PEP-CTERM sorting domain-containing protein, partial [Chthoniobacterales bacterium]
WIIASASGVISGFTGDKFTVDASHFTNPHIGTFGVGISGSNLMLVYTAIPEPSTWGAAVGMGLFAIAFMRRRRN